MKTMQISRSIVWVATVAATVLAWPNRLMAAEPVLVQEVRKLIVESPPSVIFYLGTGCSLEGDTLVAGADLANRGAQGTGTAFVFERNRGGTGNWGLVKELLPDDLVAYDHYGQNSDISGDVVAVIALPSGTNASGAVYLFERNAGGPNAWGQIAKVVAPPPRFADRFGRAVQLQGTTLVVMAILDDNERGTDAGACYIFERNLGGADNWGLAKKLVPDDLVGGDRFGAHPSLSGDTLAVGTFGQDGYRGACYIFERDAGGPDNWGLVKKLTAPDGESEDMFSVPAVDGDILVVGAYLDSEVGGQMGSAYVFERNRGGPDNWGFVKKLLPANEVPGTRFGHQTVVDGDMVAINASGWYPDPQIPGSVYLFQKDAGGPDNWGLVQRVVPSDPSPEQMFGFFSAVALEDETLVVGAPQDSEAGYHAGAVYIFHLQAPPPLAIEPATLLSWPQSSITCAVEAAPEPAGLWTITAGDFYEVADGQHRMYVAAHDQAWRFRLAVSDPGSPLYHDDFNDLNEWSWDGRATVTETGGNVLFHVNRTDATSGMNWDPWFGGMWNLNRTFTIPTAGTLELRADVVGANQDDAFVIIGTFATTRPVYGYGFAKDQNEVAIFKCCPYGILDVEAVEIKNDNITMSMALTAWGSDLEIHVRVFDRDNQNALLWEKRVMDTSGVDPTVPSGSWKGLRNEPEGQPAPYLGLASYVYAGCAYLNTERAPEPPGAEATLDGLTVLQYDVPPLAIEPAVLLIWSETPGNWILEAARDLNGPWGEVTNGSSDVLNGQRRTFVPADEQKRFFRLLLEEQP